MTAYERASIAWHGLLKMTKKGDQRFKGAGHRREASRALVSRPMKRKAGRQAGWCQLKPGIKGSWSWSKLGV